MPTDADKLTIHSTPAEHRAAISSCISQTMTENPGMEQAQAVAICHEMARKATGHGASRAV